MHVVEEKYGYVYFPINQLLYDPQKHVWVQEKDPLNIGLLLLNPVGYFLKWVESNKKYCQKSYFNSSIKNADTNSIHYFGDRIDDITLEPTQRILRMKQKQKKKRFRFMFVDKKYFFFSSPFAL
ncbi:unnamed protein product [Cuscuta europaea]|uniref:Uncharacterized protein n=1 Tax=Cuscuta europaea TaxID=41803 RepID=A0A9P1A0C3_CUSEU|nr:unnamed protein product [Cuscuta europaea]